MPDFADPYSGINSDRPLNPEEILRAIRFAIAAEYEAIQLYQQIADSSSHKDVKKVMRDIANEEIVHAGEFLRLLKKLSPDEEKFYNEGEKEVNELMKRKSSISNYLKGLSEKLDTSYAQKY